MKMAREQSAGLRGSLCPAQQPPSAQSLDCKLLFYHDLKDEYVLETALQVFSLVFPWAVVGYGCDVAGRVVSYTKSLSPTLSCGSAVKTFVF